MSSAVQARKPIPPGMAENSAGISIIDPILYVETIISSIRKGGIAGILRSGRQSTSPIFTNHPTSPPSNVQLTPNLQTMYSENYDGILSEETSTNIKTYLQLPSFGEFTRISASGYNNNCWFDSFLCCMSPRYRMLTLTQRQEVTQAFRNLCNENIRKIVNEMPTLLKELYPETELQYELSTPMREISMLAGFAIAWYFGVNIIYIKFEPTGPIIDTTMSIQSPDCKTIFMCHTGGMTGSAHYEPVGILGLTNDRLDEKKSTFVFEWTDTRICQMPNRPAEWVQPNCSTNSNAGSIVSANTNNTARRASIGGKRRVRKTRRQRLHKKRQSRNIRRR